MDVPGCGHIDRNIANLLVASESYGGGIGITRVSNRGLYVGVSFGSRDTVAPAAPASSGERRNPPNLGPPARPGSQRSEDPVDAAMVKAHVVRRLVTHQD